jgi:peptide/nickel transport system ATP-binding protein
MQVRDILREPLQINRLGSRQQQDRRVRELLEEVGLSARSAARYPHEFSGGQRQRVGLARALALNPRLVVADEPVSALDVSIRSQVLNLMNDLQRVHRLTYVVVSHDLAVIRYVSDRIAVMYLGKLVEIGPRDAVYRRPAHPYTAALVQAIPVPDPEVERAKKVVPLAGELPSAIDPPSGCRFRTRCPRAQQLCAEVEPQQRVFGPRHEAACHFPLLTPPAGEREGVGIRTRPRRTGDGPW